MTITVTLPSGETAEVEPSALSLPEGAQIVGPDETPHGFVREDFFQAEMKRRSGDAKAIRKQLAADPEFRAGVLADFGLDVDDEGKPKVPDVSAAVKNAREKWEAEALAPEREARQKIEANLARTAILAAAAGKVDERFTRPPMPGAPAYVETVLGSRVKYDPELGYVVALDGEGNPLPSKSGDRPYADAAEFVDSFLGSDAGAALRAPERSQQGAGYRGGDGKPAGTKTATRSQFEQMAPAQRMTFAREGGKVTDD